MQNNKSNQIRCYEDKRPLTRIAFSIPLKHYQRKIFLKTFKTKDILYNLFQNQKQKCRDAFAMFSFSTDFEIRHCNKHIDECVRLMKHKHACAKDYIKWICR